MNKFLHKRYDLDGWFHKHFNFKNNTEFCIFLVWVTFVVGILTSIR